MLLGPPCGQRWHTVISDLTKVTFSTVHLEDFLKESLISTRWLKKKIFFESSGLEGGLGAPVVCFVSRCPQFLNATLMQLSARERECKHLRLTGGWVNTKGYLQKHARVLGWKGSTRAHLLLLLHPAGSAKERSSDRRGGERLGNACVDGGSPR